MSDQNDDDNASAGNESASLMALSPEDVIASFEDDESLPAASVVGATDIARAVAEVEARMARAQARPRSPKTALQRMIAECQRPAVAEKACYEYPRGGKTVTGPSIRLAEAMARHWGNCEAGYRELERRPATGGQPGYTVVLAYAWDLETNVLFPRTFQVPHVREKGEGNYNLEDPRDVYEATANAAQRRVRACILAMIPPDIREACVETACKTMEETCSLTPKRLEEMAKRLGAHGVTVEQIEAKILCAYDRISPAQFLGLFRILTSLDDRMSAPGDWFKSNKPKVPAKEGATAGLKAQLGVPAGPSKVEPASPAAKADPPAPGVGNEKPAGVVPADIVAAAEKAGFDAKLIPLVAKEKIKIPDLEKATGEQLAKLLAFFKSKDAAAFLDLLIQKGIST